MNNEIKPFAHRSNGAENKSKKSMKTVLGEMNGIIRKKAGVILAGVLVMVIVASVAFGKSERTEAVAQTGNAKSYSTSIAEAITGIIAEAFADESDDLASESESELVLMDDEAEEFIYIPANMGAVDSEGTSDTAEENAVSADGNSEEQAAENGITIIENEYDETTDIMLMDGEDMVIDHSEMPEAVAERIAREEAAAAEEARLEQLRREEAAKLAAERAAGDAAVPTLVMGKDWSSELTSDDLEVLYHIVEAEATGEDAIGKILVANVILNRVSDSRFKNTVYGVVFERIGGSAQFSPTIDGRYWSVPIEESTKEAVRRAVAGEDYSNGALYFFQRSLTTEKKARWFENSLKYLFKHGCHEFYKEKK